MKFKIEIQEYVVFTTAYGDVGKFNFHTMKDDKGKSIRYNDILGRWESQLDGGGYNSPRWVSRAGIMSDAMDKAYRYWQNLQIEKILFDTHQEDK